MGTPREPLVFVSGFGPFETVGLNPSGEIALALAASPPAGTGVRAVVLPVSFARAPETWDAAFAELAGQGRRPDLVVALGVAKRPGFRLERFASPELKLVPRADVDGRSDRAVPHAWQRAETGVHRGRMMRT